MRMSNQLAREVSAIKFQTLPMVFVAPSAKSRLPSSEESRCSSSRSRAVALLSSLFSYRQPPPPWRKVLGPEDPNAERYPGRKNVHGVQERCADGTWRFFSSAFRLPIRRGAISLVEKLLPLLTLSGQGRVLDGGGFGAVPKPVEVRDRIMCRRPKV